MIKRIFLFLATNIAVLLVLGVVLKLLGLEQIHTAQGGIDYRALLVFAAVVGFTGSFISLALSKWIAKFSSGAKIIKQPSNETERWLVSTVGELARKAGIGMPDVAVFPSEDVNAFATGARKNHALVAVSAGLLRSMTREEIEAVLGHEIAHVANGDMVTLTLIQGVLNTFVIFLSRIVGYFVDGLLSQGEGGRRRGYGPGFWIATIVSQILLGILASMIVAWFSRRREFRADAGGAKYTSTQQMTGALQRLQSIKYPSALPDSMAAFGIREGGKRNWLAGMMSTHPPLEERIGRLTRA